MRLGKFVVWGVISALWLGLVVMGPGEGQAAPRYTFTARSSAYPTVKFGHETIKELSSERLLVHMDDPPQGSEWDTDPYILKVPDGYCWRLAAVSYHVTTSTLVTPRNTKLVIRDLSDQIDNKGRDFRILGLKFGANVYFDAAADLDGAAFPNVQGQSSSPSNLLITHGNNSLPDMWLMPGFGWATVTDRHDTNPQIGDQFEEFWAWVDQDEIGDGEGEC